MTFRLRALIFLVILTALCLTGCAGSVRLDKIDKVTLCRDGTCSTVDRITEIPALKGALFRLLQANEGEKYTICASKPETRECASNGLTHYVQGGPIPGFGTLTGMEIEEVGYDPSVDAIVAVVDPDLYFIGTPLLTTSHKTVLKVTEPRQISLVDQESYTNWMAVGNQIFSFNIAIDYIDTSRGILGGWYGWGMAGIGSGGGSGYALMTFPKTGDDSWFAAIQDDAPLLAAPVTLAQQDQIAQKAKDTVAAGPGTTAEEAAEHADNLAREQERVTLAENVLAEEAKRAERKRQEISRRKEELAKKEELARGKSQKDVITARKIETEKIRRQHEAQLLKEQQLLEQERKRLAEVRALAETRRQELEKLRQELEVQQQEALRLKEERLLAEQEQMRIKAQKATERKRLESIRQAIHFGKYHALVIGINSYTSLPVLKTAVNDATAIAELLQKKYNFSTTLLVNASRGDILKSLSGYRKKLSNDDNLLIYYAGHGWLDEAADEGYWLPADATLDDPVEWIANTTITTTLKAMNAKHVMVVADSCYAGKLMRGIQFRKKEARVLEKLAEKRTRVVLSSGGLEPVSDDGYGKHSVFARAFMNALDDNKAILDGTQLFDLIRNPVMAAAEQTPEYADIYTAGHEGGDFLFVRRDK
ncbi:MAG: caspase family protein [Desulfobulbaceae bacterium]|nr:caspase family protein [Desulfobulbaceae bacterium]